MSVRIIVGDCLDAMPTLAADSIDSIVTDPPYGLGFMGKDWDHGVPGEHFWREALRVAKPGAHLLAFGGTRTFHRLMVAIEDAEWEIRDTIMWVYGSGFPKSLDVSKAIDREAGATRAIFGGKPGNSCDGNPCRCTTDNGRFGKTVHAPATAPATAPAMAWQGWGTALKPSWEPIIVARKPLAGTVAANVLQFGTGALNIDASRIEGAKDTPASPRRASQGPTYGELGNDPGTGTGWDQSVGRWPANLIHDGSDEVVALFPAEAGAFAPVRGTEPSRPAKNTYGEYARGGGAFHGDIGSAARFFYCAKADREDRNNGCEALPKHPLNWSSGTQSPGTFQSEGTDKTAHNNHPTVKPAELMAYLVRLVTPPGGTVLDPFAGSGSTGLAADRLQFNAVLIELDPAYAAIAEQRIRGDMPLFAEIA